MVEINLLPWRAQVMLAQQQKQRQIWRVLVVLGFVFLCAEMIFETYFQQKLGAIAYERQSIQTDIPTMENDQAQLAAQMTSKLNHFLAVCQKISTGEQYHIHLVKMNFVDKKVVIAGNVNSIADLSEWVKELNTRGLHVFVQQLTKSVPNDQFHFLVLI